MIEEPAKTRLTVGARLGPYRIEALIGAGGMGDVFRAEDTRLGRTVAIKVIRPEFAGMADFRHRFDREARAISALNHPHICSLYDIGDQDGFAYLVMEYVQGENLADVLRKGVLPMDFALRYGAQIADALAAAHALGITHRDLKPANIMISQTGAKVLDFGLAKRANPVGKDEETGGPSGETRAGAIVGTIGYVSPEQAEGKAVDARSDVFSFGVMLYEMICGVRPFQGSSTLSILASILRETPEQPRNIRPELSDRIERVILRCLEKNPEARFHSASEVRLALQEESPSIPRRMALPRGAVFAALLVLAILTGVLGFQKYRSVSRARWAVTAGLPEVTRLVNQLQPLKARALFSQVEQYSPLAPEVIRMKDILKSFDFQVHTTPEGADIYIRDYSGEENGDSGWQLLGRSPFQTDRLPRRYSLFRVRAVKTGFETVEWAVMLGGSDHESLQIPLHTLKETPPGMVWVDGITEVGKGQTNPAVTVSTTPMFWLDRYEVRNREYKQFVDNDGYQKQEYWKYPIIKDGKVLPWQRAMKEFHDATGLPGPATWELGSYPDGKADFPVGGVSWYEAAAYAEFADKSLPTAFHWYRAAAINNSSDILNFSNFAGRGPAQVGSSQGLGRYGNFDMAGNVQEWVFNSDADLRFTLGGAWNTPAYLFGAGHPDARRPIDREPSFGFRCAKYPDPIPDALKGQVALASRDRRKDKPVDDQAYRIIERLHHYDTTDLKSSVDSVEDRSPSWRVEHVSFQAAYGNERVIAHLYLPKNAAPPYQIVAYMGGTDALTRRTSDAEFVSNYFEFFLRSGRAVIVPAYKGMLDRGPGAYYHLLGEPNRWSEMNLQWSKDLGRSIDYLETRKDIDVQKLTFYAVSMGAAAAPRLVAVEKRVKTAILLSGGTWEKVPDEVDPWNFASRVTVPVLMLNGSDDFAFNREISQIPLFQMLGTPNANKKHKLFAGGHASPLTQLDMVKEVLDWMDHYIGPVHNRP